MEEREREENVTGAGGGERGGGGRVWEGETEG